jgi:phosphatidate cytidylyltransferase
MTGCILWNNKHDPYLLFLLFGTIMIIGMFEVFNMFYQKENYIKKALTISFGLISIIFTSMISLGNFRPSHMWSYIIPIALISLMIIIKPIINLYISFKKPSKNVALIIIPIFYIIFPASLMLLIGIDRYIVLLVFFILIWANDVGAYCFGMLFGQHGKHKLFPRISPKKTWEGFIGGVVTAMIASILVSKFMLHKEQFYHWIIIAIITSVLGTFGDLIESMLKRSAGVKDSGKIMPGHGGILDRFDSAFFAFPIFFSYISLLLKYDF